MTLTPPSDSPRGLTGTQWLICVIAAIGFAFDIYELLMLPFIVRPALLELGGLRAGHRRGSRTGPALLFYVPALARRDLRAAGRIPDRPARPPAGADVVDPALRVLRVLRRVLDEPVDAAVLPLHDVHRRVRRVRGGRRVAGGAVPGARPPREGARLHAGVQLDRRVHGRRRQRARRRVGAAAAGHRRCRSGWGSDTCRTRTRRGATRSCPG